MRGISHTFVSLTKRKMAREKNVERHSTHPVHQERFTYPPGGHYGDLGVSMSFAPLAAIDRRGGIYSVTVAK